MFCDVIPSETTVTVWNINSLGIICSKVSERLCVCSIYLYSFSHSVPPGTGTTKNLNIPYVSSLLSFFYGFQPISFTLAVHMFLCPLVFQDLVPSRFFILKPFQAVLQNDPQRRISLIVQVESVQPVPGSFLHRQTPKDYESSISSASTWFARSNFFFYCWFWQKSLED